MNRDVSVAFSADVSGYTQSLDHAISSTEQMDVSMTRMIGRLASLNRVVPMVMKQISGLSKENKVATAQATAYQQKLAGLEATATVLNKTSSKTTVQFKDLAKTATSMARDFPIGIEGAVEQLQMLQTSGVKTEKQISGLATAFTKLGAANNANGAAIGKDMLSLSRMFGHDTVEKIDKLGDSLTTVSASAGASAEGVLSFSKSIAPIASTMGMSQTQVMGISAAMASMGEDGMAAGNALNKVMLDMNKSIREGSPLVRNYADLMGKTVEETKQLFDQNPAEALTQFVDAVAKKGPEAIRALDDIGVGGMRTVKALTTMSRADMSKTLEEASAAYGNGSTAEGAKAAFGGVNDQMTMLQETMSQTVANAGKPFLGLLEIATRIAKEFADAINAITGNEGIQKIAKISAVAFTAMKLFRTGGLALSLPLQMKNALMSQDATKTFAGSFKLGAYDEVTTPGGASNNVRAGIKSDRAYRVGAWWGNQGLPMFGDLGRNTGQDSSQAAKEKGSGILSRAGRGVLGGVTVGAQYLRNDMRKAREAEIDRTDGGNSLRSGLSAASGSVSLKGIDTAKFKDGLKEAGDGFKSLTNQTNSFGTALKGAAREGIKFHVEAARLTAETAAKGAMKVGSKVGGALNNAGITPLAIGMAAAGAAFTTWKSEQSKKAESKERGWADGNRAFNEFAEKAGLATKSVITLTEELQKSTNVIAGQNKSRKEALQIDDEEARDSAKAGYNRSYTSSGDGKDADAEARAIRTKFGTDLSNTELARIMADVTNQFGRDKASKIGEKLDPMMSESEDKTLGEALEEHGRSFDKKWASDGKRTKYEIENPDAYGSKRKDVDGGILGGWASNDKTNALGEDIRTEVVRYRKSLEETYGKTEADRLAIKTAEATWEKLNKAEYLDTDLAAEVMEKLLGASGKESDIKKAIQGRNASFESVVGATGKADEINKVRKDASGGDTGLEPESTPAYMRRKMADDKYEKATSKVSAFADAMDVGRRAALDLGMKVSEVASSEGFDALTDDEKLLIRAEASPEDQGAQFSLARKMALMAMGDDASSPEALQKILMQLAESSTANWDYRATERAYGLTQKMTAVDSMGLSQTEKWAQQGKTNRQTIEMFTSTDSPNDALSAAGESAYDEEVQRIGEVKSFAMSYLKAERDLGIQLDRQRRAFELSQSRAEEQYSKQRMRGKRDFDMGMARSEEDYQLSVTHAKEDFNIAVARQNEEFAINAKRQSEEAAKAIADPFSKMAAQQVVDMGLLVSNMAQQADQAEEQLAGVAELRRMGLTKEAVDQLGLLGANMNSQVQRLISGALDDPKSIDELNKVVSRRIKAGEGISQNEASKTWENQVADFQRGQSQSMADFNKSLDRQEDAFKKTIKRSTADFSKSMNDARDDFELSMSHAKEDADIAAGLMHEDLAKMLTEVTTNWDSEIEEFAKRISELPSKVAPSAADGIKELVDKMKETWNTEMSTGWAGAGEGTEVNGGTFNGPFSQSLDKGDYFKGAPDYLSGWKGGAAEIAKGGSWGSGFGVSAGYRGGKVAHNGVDIKAGGGAPITTPLGGRVVWIGGENDTHPQFSSIVKHLKTGAKVPWAGNSVVLAFDTDGGVTKYIQFAHMHDIAKGLKPGDVVKAGGVVGTVGNTGNSSGNHLHMSVYEGNKKVNPRNYLAMGGIATRQTTAMIAEAGHPEAVIPLNDRGVSVLASAMKRYISSTDALSTRTSGYTTYVTNNSTHYDQSTRVTGPITVQTSNPDEMLERIRQRSRRSALVRSR